MTKASLSAQISPNSPFVVPAGSALAFSVFSLGFSGSNLRINGVDVARIGSDTGGGVGQFYADEDSTIATSENPFGISGLLETPE